MRGSCQGLGATSPLWQECPRGFLAGTAPSQPPAHAVTCRAEPRGEAQGPEWLESGFESTGPLGVTQPSAREVRCSLCLAGGRLGPDAPHRPRRVGWGDFALLLALGSQLLCCLEAKDGQRGCPHSVSTHCVPGPVNSEAGKRGLGIGGGGRRRHRAGKPLSRVPLGLSFPIFRIRAFASNPLRTLVCAGPSL